jgi:hypothetical protein
VVVMVGLLGRMLGWSDTGRKSVLLAGLREKWIIDI